jgi:pilus assembly protein FimV
MLPKSQIRVMKFLCLLWLSWACAASAISIGSPKLLSKPGDPLKVEFPIKVSQEELGLLDSLNVNAANSALYERLGISRKLFEFNPQAMIYRNQQQKLMVLLQTVEPVPIGNDPFLDVLLTLNWSAGSSTKTYTLLLGDVQKISVASGQTLSEIAAQLAPQLDGATLDQTMMALFKANPDAFASGSINQLKSGAELTKPSQALLRSISPAEANQFVAESNAQWQSERESKRDGLSPSTLTKNPQVAAQDRLKIGSSVEGNAQELRYAEELVAQERSLEQTRARVAELEKNIADLQLLLDQAKDKSKNLSGQANFDFLSGFGPFVLTLLLMGFTGFLLWALAKNARRSELKHFSRADSMKGDIPKERSASKAAIPDRAKALFASIDLDLTSPINKQVLEAEIKPNALDDVVRVKLNLAKAYMTIEDFSAAKKSLEEIINIGVEIDPLLINEAEGLLLKLSLRNT